MAAKLDPTTAITDPHGITWGMHPIAWRNDDIPEVGEWNTIDFTEPYAFLVEHGYKGWILVEAEQDPKIAPPLEYAHIARDYVKGTLLGQ